nr:ATP-binding cassette domain-containing protein [Candidatus Saccharibacteria bacterium]
MSVIVKVSNLTKKYGENVVVDNISFSVEKGEVFGILGPNGAGKTTTLEMIEAMRPIDGGFVHVNGLDVAKDPQKIRYIIGVQPQSAAFQDKSKLKEILQMFAAAYGEK